MSRLEVDIFGGAETRLHWDLTPKSIPLKKQLNLHDGCKISTAHNVNERFSQCQQGGTFITAMEEVSTYVSEVGIDNEGLGRWTWMKLAGATRTTRVIFAYQPCKTRKQATQATYAQQRRYWRLQGEHSCPRKLFREQLTTLLTEWRHNDEKIILLLIAMKI